METLKDILQAEASPLPQELKQARSREAYAHVVLTDEETEEALRVARKIKHGKQALSDYGKKVFADRVYLVHSADELKEIILKRFFDRYKKNYVIDDSNRQVFDFLCHYFSGDERFEANIDFSLSKGILLYGNVGVGKTELMRMFCQNHIASFGLFSCRDISNSYIENGYDEVERFNRIRTGSLNQYGQKEFGCCFDDLGTENSTSQHFGSKKNLMAEIIMNRYDNGINFNMTHITTNLSIEEIENTYGTRCIDRMAQMFNQINFPTSAKSRR